VAQFNNVPDIEVGQLWHSEVYKEVVEVTYIGIDGLILETKCFTQGSIYKTSLEGAFPKHTLSYSHFLSRYRPITKLHKYLYQLEEHGI
jgi:hypothetical protein